MRLKRTEVLIKVKSNKIFITGGSGFIGQHVLNEIADENREVLLLTHKTNFSLEKNMVKAIKGDISCFFEIKEEIMRFAPEVCIYCAWEGLPDYSEEISKKNLFSSINMFDFLVNEAKCRKIIVPGSCFEYGKSYGICKESNRVKAASFFVWAKQSLYSYAALLCEGKATLIWFRIFYVYGPGQGECSLIPVLTDVLKKKEKPRINNPFNSNDFIHVKDVARAIGMAADKEIKSGIYNLGSGKTYRVIDICKIVERLIYGKTDFSDELEFSAKPSAAANFWADIGKTKKNLSWEPQISIEDGIREYLKEEASA